MKNWESTLLSDCFHSVMQQRKLLWSKWTIQVSAESLQSDIWVEKLVGVYQEFISHQECRAKKSSCFIFSFKWVWCRSFVKPAFRRLFFLTVYMRHHQHSPLNGRCICRKWAGPSLLQATASTSFLVECCAAQLPGDLSYVTTQSRPPGPGVFGVFVCLFVCLWSDSW